MFELLRIFEEKKMNERKHLHPIKLAIYKNQKVVIKSWIASTNEKKEKRKR